MCIYTASAYAAAYSALLPSPPALVCVCVFVCVFVCVCVCVCVCGVKLPWHTHTQAELSAEKAAILREKKKLEGVEDEEDSMAARVAANEVCWRMLTYADVCWRMLTHSCTCRCEWGMYMWLIYTYILVCVCMCVCVSVCVLYIYIY